MVWTRPRVWEDAEVRVWGGQSPRTVLVSKGWGGGLQSSAGRSHRRMQGEKPYGGFSACLLHTQLSVTQSFVPRGVHSKGGPLSPAAYVAAVGHTP